MMGSFNYLHSGPQITEEWFQFQAPKHHHRDGAPHVSPPIDLVNDPDGLITLYMELPGRKRSDIEIQVFGHTLVITGTIPASVSAPSSPNHSPYRIRERCWGPFSRSVPFDHLLEAGDVKATLEDGLLKVEVPGKKGEGEGAKAGRVTVL